MRRVAAILGVAAIMLTPAQSRAGAGSDARKPGQAVSRPGPAGAGASAAPEVVRVMPPAGLARSPLPTRYAFTPAEASRLPDGDVDFCASATH